MNDDEIRSLVSTFDTKDNALRETIWQQLKPLGERFLPFFKELFPLARRSEARRDIAFHSIRFARVSDSAFRIGLAAIADRSSIVRYRGCCVLAYSLRQEALPQLQALTSHADLKTVDDARAAIDAIEHRNHHLFIDRSHSGRSFWTVNPEDDKRT
jgi:hypothetical protein